MPAPAINTVDPVALRYLMTETVFSVEDGSADTLVETRTGSKGSEPHKPEQAAPSFVFFGQNKRNYLFLSDEKQHEWMSEVAMDAFVKTLAALKLAADDVALLNLAKLAEPPSIGQLALFFKPKVVVNLGTKFVWPEQHDVKLFHTYAFGDMLADAEKKRAFWTTIKHLLI
ncbi:MAG TPA: hypothetical protein VNQ80_20455 [Parapedobacter sp.]|nr:hypothetical protein [Parapedobacter sp.]